MGHEFPITDPGWRAAVDAALERNGELLAIVAYTSQAGRRDWFLIKDQADLEVALSKVDVRRPIGPSDMIVIAATPELPHRGTDDAALCAAAQEIAARSWVIMACKRDGDPELHDLDACETVAGVDEWFRDKHEGLRLIGEDPYVIDERACYPDGHEEFIAFGARPDGTVKPGAY